MEIWLWEWMSGTSAKKLDLQSDSSFIIFWCDPLFRTLICKVSWHWQKLNARELPQILLQFYAKKSQIKKLFRKNCSLAGEWNFFASAKVRSIFGRKERNWINLEQTRWCEEIKIRRDFYEVFRKIRPESQGNKKQHSAAIFGTDTELRTFLQRFLNVVEQ